MQPPVTPAKTRDWSELRSGPIVAYMHRHNIVVSITDDIGKFIIPPPPAPI